MFNNIGRKIKALAKIQFIVLAIIDFIVGIVILSVNEYLIAAGLSVMLIGPILAWISSWILYGYGQLIENSDKLAKNVCETQDQIFKDRTNEEKTTEISTEKIGKCELCGKENVEISDVKIVDNLGTRYRAVCSDCYKNNNAQPAK